VDYSIIVAAVVTGIFTIIGTVVVAEKGKRVARDTGVAVQTAEQVEAKRLVDDARVEAEHVKDQAKVTADAVVARALETAERTDQERDGWHLAQLASLTAERDDLRTENAALRATLRREGTA
jgi:hypothetical protein